MTKTLSAGEHFRSAVAQNKPLQIVGAINPYCAMMAEKIGYQAIYLSGSGVASASYGLPDLGITTIDNVVTDINRITSASTIPLLVDADTGWGSALNIARTIQQFEKAGAAGCHIEDQVVAKRCGHRPNKMIVSTVEMVDRLKTAVDARTDHNFVIMARTDALASEGLTETIERIEHYVNAGADMIFPEAVESLEVYQTITSKTKVPVLANLTEFGKTPLFDLNQLNQAGIAMALYPLTVFRAMNAAAEHTYLTIKQQGTQKNCIDQLQTRDKLYDYLNYHHYEDILDRLFTKE